MNGLIEARNAKVVTLQLPRKLAFLMKMHPYKVAYGGRNSLKSHSFAGALLTLGLHQSLRILCVREVQKSLADSVHQLLKDKISALGYDAHYDITDNSITSRTNQTLFRFAGLSDQTVTSIKSYEGFDVAWAEEAQNISKNSWQILLPTIFRNKSAEVWVSFNPALATDETWVRFVVNPPPGAKVVEMNWRDAVSCGWFPPEQERLRQYDLVYSKDDYENIWEGKPRTTVIGAIYAPEVNDMITSRRYLPLPYDPRLPVHRIWDLGWNDLMVCIMVQKPHPSALNVINYIEDSQITYAQMLSAMDRLHYRWGLDWLPHDGEQHHPTSGTNAIRQLSDLGCRLGRTSSGVGIPKSDPESRIKAARMMFPRIYMDCTTHDTPTDRPERVLGAAHLMGRLQHYRRSIPKTTGEPSGPLHDKASHGADAWGGMAEIVNQIKNDGERTKPNVGTFANHDSGMGMLGG